MEKKQHVHSICTKNKAPPSSPTTSLAGNRRELPVPSTRPAPSEQQNREAKIFPGLRLNPSLLLCPDNIPHRRVPPLPPPSPAPSPAPVPSVGEVLF